MPGKTGQKKLQLAMAGLFILVVFLVEMVAVTPKGIYVESTTGITPFEIGMDKDKALTRINRQKTIRELITCSPDTIQNLTSRKGFKMSPELSQSRIWIATDRKKGRYWLRFSGQGLDLILLYNEPGKESPLLSQGCSPEFSTDPLTWLEQQATIPVYMD